MKLRKKIHEIVNNILVGLTTSSLSDVGSSVLKEMVEIFPSSVISDENVLAIPKHLQYEFSRKQAYIFENVRIFPQHSLVGVPQKNTLIFETGFNPYRFNKVMLSEKINRFPAEKAIGLCTSIQGGSMWENYYHWLIDDLPRLYALTHPIFQSEPVIYLYLSGAIPLFVQNILDYLLPKNIKIVKIEPNQSLFAESYIWLPYLSGDCSGYLPYECHQWFVDRIKPMFAIDALQEEERLIYISRQLAKKRKYLNEDKLITALTKLGIHPYYLENHSFKEQVSLFTNAKLVVGRHGAGFTNLLFSKQARVLEHFSDKPTNHYRLLCKAKNLKYSNLVSPDGGEKNSDIIAPIDEIVSHVELLLSQP